MTSSTVEIDKSTWGEGPWQHEPDRVEWVHAGYACLVRRHRRHGNLCGYVGVDSSHPYYGKDCDECDVKAHCGIDYSNKCDGEVCHVPAPGMPDDVWWLGFACSVGIDMSPALNARLREAREMPTPPGYEKLHKELNRLISLPGENQYEEVYRDYDYVRHETESLAEQLRAIAEAKQG